METSNSNIKNATRHKQKLITVDSYSSAVTSRDLESLKKLFEIFYLNDKLIVELIYSAIRLNKPCNKIIIYLMQRIHRTEFIDEQMIYELFKVKNIEKSIFDAINLIEDKFGLVLNAILLNDNLKAFKKIPWYKTKGDIILYSSIPEYAVHQNSVKILSAYLKKKDFIKKYKYACVYLAIRNGNFNILRILIALGAKLYPLEELYLNVAYRNLRATIAKFLMQHIFIGRQNVSNEVLSFIANWDLLKETVVVDSSFITFLKKEYILNQNLNALNNLYGKEIQMLNHIEDDVFYAFKINKIESAINLIHKMSFAEINHLLMHCILTNRFKDSLLILSLDLHSHWDYINAMELACFMENTNAINFIIQNVIVQSKTD